jgi:hypothetical protein
MKQAKPPETTYCKICSKEYIYDYKKNRRYKCTTCKSREQYQKRDKLLSEIKNVPCMDCGNNFPPECMDFDHRDPSTKLFGVGDRRDKGIKIILDEISKCDIVCANCHRIRTKSKKQYRVSGGLE